MLECALDSPEIWRELKWNSARSPHNKGYGYSCTVSEFWKTTGIFWQSHGVRLVQWHRVDLFWQRNFGLRGVNLSHCDSWHERIYFWAGPWRQQGVCWRHVHVLMACREEHRCLSNTWPLTVNPSRMKKRHTTEPLDGWWERSWRCALFSGWCVLKRCWQRA